MWSRKGLFLVLCFFTFHVCLQAQTNSEETIKSGFADYLFNLKLYDFASEEYERLLFEDPNNLIYLKKLIKSYRYSGKAQFLKNKLDQSSFNDPEVLAAYFKLLITEGFNEEANNLLQSRSSSFDNQSLDKLEFQLALSNKDWKKANHLFKPEIQEEPFLGLMSSINGTKYKSPGLAAGLSAIIPGAGRFYAKDHKDGIISFIFVVGTAFQAYRRFDKNGINSKGGWIYGGIALGFYVSNIYGSYQSAKYYNNKIDTKLHERSLYHINADLDL